MGDSRGCAVRIWTRFLSERNGTLRETDRLWAPWRLDFITRNGEETEESPEPKKSEGEAGTDSGCFICEALADNRDKERYVFSRSEFAVGILNRYPYNNGHLLIAPKRHLGKLSDLSEEELRDINLEILRWIARLEKEMRPDGFNVGLNLGHAAGAGLPGHIHWHVVPRWFGDTNFMTSVGSTKVIPQSLEALWSILTRPESP